MYDPFCLDVLVFVLELLQNVCLIPDEKIMTILRVKLPAHCRL